MLNLLAASLILQTAPAVAQAAQAVAAPAKEKKSCRQETPTGSMMARSVCHSKAEWAALDQQAGGAANEFHDRMNRGGTGPTR